MGWMIALAAIGYIVLVEKPQWMWKVWKWVKAKFSKIEPPVA